MVYETWRVWKTSAGLWAGIVRQEAGHLCGYVALPRGHAFYGCEYDACLDKMKLFDAEIKSGTVGKRGAIDILCAVADPDRLRFGFYFDVHGGITYSAAGEPPDYPFSPGESGLDLLDTWFLGFDCNHCDDASSPETETKHCVYRNEPYVAGECESLAEQIQNYAKRIEDHHA